MNIIAYCALHYGQDYLYHAIRSVIDYVDEFYILYSPVGSHGTRVAIPCPDTREVLYELAGLAAGDKLRWVDGEWAHEGLQRETIHLVAPDADVILVVDADEIWGENLAWYVLDGISNRWPKGLARSYRLPIIHYWRSFYRAVLHDPAFPTRVILPKLEMGEGSIDFASAGNRPLIINHMGYAQLPYIVEYKQHVHGHRGEWRWGEDWFRARFLCNAQVDCHPVGSIYWNPEPVDPWQYMPDFMRNHPYAHLNVIGEVVEPAR